MWTSVFGGTAHLTLHHDKLVADGRKIMRSLHYFHREEIDGRVVVELLWEAQRVHPLGIYKN